MLVSATTANADRQSTAVLKMTSRGMNLIGNFAGRKRPNLLKDLEAAERFVRNAVSVPLFDYEYEAMVSLMLDRGPGRTAAGEDLGYDGIVTLASGRPSTLLLNLNRGNYQIAADCFTMWRDPGSPQELELTRRRIAEQLTFLGLPWQRAVAGIASIPTPQQMTAIQAAAEEEAVNLRAIKVLDAGVRGPKPFDPSFPNRSVYVPPPKGDAAVTYIVDAKGVYETGPTEPKPAPANEQKPAPAAAPQPPPAVTPAIMVKNFLMSRRGWGQILNTVGHGLQALAIIGAFGPDHYITKFARNYGVIVNDPVLLQLAADVLVMQIGWVLTHVGGFIRAWGEKHAKHPLGTAKEVETARRAAIIQQLAQNTAKAA